MIIKFAMPRRSRNKTLKSLIVDTAIFIGVFVLVGNLSLNIWERFIIQKNLSNIRISLQSLKDTVNKIGFAYDNLHHELAGLSKETQAKQMALLLLQKETLEPSHKRALEITLLQDKNIQATKSTKDHTTLTTPQITAKNPQITAKNPLIECPNANNNHTKYLSTNNLREKNISTITRSPLKSTCVGIGLGELKYYKDIVKPYRNIHKCYKIYD